LRFNHHIPLEKLRRLVLQLFTIHDATADRILLGHLDFLFVINGDSYFDVLFGELGLIRYLSLDDEEGEAFDLLVIPAEISDAQVFFLQSPKLIPKLGPPLHWDF
jgi:hypothetical protein